MTAVHTATAPRFPLDLASLPLAQQDAHAEIVKRRGAFPPPYHALLASPDVALMVESLSTRLWSGHLSQATLETVFLVTARRFQCEHQWARHEPKALAAGVPPECIQAIARGLKPAGPAPLVVAAQVARRLLSGQRIGRRLWAQATWELGAPGVADLCAFLGLAAMVAMAINVQEDSQAATDAPAAPAGSSSTRTAAHCPTG